DNNNGGRLYCTLASAPHKSRNNACVANRDDTIGLEQTDDSSADNSTALGIDITKLSEKRISRIASQK
ncbi:MAG: hypothetical protein ACRCUS_02760, partial [Anaerovoracaceae bacterium]